MTYSRKLAGFTEIIDQILTDDRSVHFKQRHTGAQIFEQLRDEHTKPFNHAAIIRLKRLQRKG